MGGGFARYELIAEAAFQASKDTFFFGKPVVPRRLRVHAHRRSRLDGPRARLRKMVKKKMREEVYNRCGVSCEGVEPRLKQYKCPAAGCKFCEPCLADTARHILTCPLLPPGRKGKVAAVHTGPDDTVHVKCSRRGRRKKVIDYTFVATTSVSNRANTDPENKTTFAAVSNIKRRKYEKAATARGEDLVIFGGSVFGNLANEATNFIKSLSYHGGPTWQELSRTVSQCIVHTSGMVLVNAFYAAGVFAETPPVLFEELPLSQQAAVNGDTNDKFATFAPVGDDVVFGDDEPLYQCGSSSDLEAIERDLRELTELNESHFRERFIASARQAPVDMHALTDAARVEEQRRADEDAAFELHCEVQRAEDEEVLRSQGVLMAGNADPQPLLGEPPAATPATNTTAPLATAGAPASKTHASPAQGEVTAPTTNNHSGDVGTSPSNGDAAQLRDAAPVDVEHSVVIEHCATAVATCVEYYRAARASWRLLCHRVSVAAVCATYLFWCAVCFAVLCVYVALVQFVSAPVAISLLAAAICGARVAARVAREWMSRKVRQHTLSLFLLSLVFILLLLSCAALFVNLPGASSTILVFGNTESTVKNLPAVSNPPAALCDAVPLEYILAEGVFPTRRADQTPTSYNGTVLLPTSPLFPPNVALELSTITIVENLIVSWLGDSPGLFITLFVSPPAHVAIHRLPGGASFVAGGLALLACNHVSVLDFVSSLPSIVFQLFVSPHASRDNASNSSVRRLFVPPPNKNTSNKTAVFVGLPTAMPHNLSLSVSLPPPNSTGARGHRASVASTGIVEPPVKRKSKKGVKDNASARVGHGVRSVRGGWAGWFN